MIHRLQIYQGQQGFSLLEALISIGILSLLALGLSVLVGSFQGSLQASEEKLSILELNKVLLSISGGRNICAKDIIDNPTSYTFPTATFPPANVAVKSLYLSVGDPNALAKENEYLSSQSSVRVKTMSLSGISGTANPYYGQLQIEFETKKTSRKPLSVPVVVLTNVVAGNTIIHSCFVPADMGSGQSGNPSESEALCATAGGDWVEPPSPRPAFCRLSNEVIEWH